MTTKDFIKDDVYWEALLALCEEKDLNKITVNDVIDKAGTARQTFYNRFRDINDMICYFPIRNVERGFENEPDRRAALTKIYEYAFENKPFFSRLPFHSSQNNFRETFLQRCVEVNIADAGLEEADENYDEKYLAIFFYSAGATSLLLEWCAQGMEMPIDKLVDTMINARPPFLKERPSTLI